MLKKHSQLFEGLFTASDILVVSVAWTTSYWLRFSPQMLDILPQATFKGIPPFGDYLKMLLFVWLIWAFVFRRFGLYRPMRGQSRLREAWLVAKANSFSVLLLLAATYLFREKSVEFSRLVFVFFWGFSTVLTVLSRAMVRGFLRSMRRRGFNLRYALVVGAGEVAQKAAQRMVQHPEFGMQLVGCLASSQQEATNPAPGFRAVQKSRGPRWREQSLWEEQSGNLARAYEEVYEPINRELPIVGVYEDLPLFISNGRIDQVIVALPHCDTIA